MEANQHLRARRSDWQSVGRVANFPQKSARGQIAIKYLKINSRNYMYDFFFLFHLNVVSFIVALQVLLQLQSENVQLDSFSLTHSQVPGAISVHWVFSRVSRRFQRSLLTR